MTDVKAKVIREITPRQKAEDDCLRGQLHAALDQVVKLSGEVAAGGAVIKNMLAKAEEREEKIRDLEEQLRKATGAPATE